MALQKTKELASGITGNYWKILQVNIDYLNSTSHVTIALYVDEEARAAGKNPLAEQQSFNWQGEEFPFGSSDLSAEDVNPLKVAYAKIKESVLDAEGEKTNFFGNAEDV